MKFNEIYTSPSRDEYLSNYERNFSENTTIVAKHNGKEVWRCDDDDFIYLGVFDQYQLISYLSVIIHGSLYQIGRTAVHRDFRQLGWMRCLLDYFVHNIGILRSDNQQTIEAQDMWRAMIRMPGETVIFLVDTKDGTREHIIAQGEKIIPDPWEDQKRSSFIEIEKREPPSEQELRHRRLSGRIIEWYGVPGSPDGRLINP